MSVPVAGRSPCHLRAVQSGGAREDVRCGGYQLGLVTSITAYDCSAAGSTTTQMARGPLQGQSAATQMAGIEVTCEMHGQSGNQTDGLEKRICPVSMCSARHPFSIPC